MPPPANLAKAKIKEIKWDESQTVRDGDPERTVVVQFNPETLKVGFSNQSSGGDQRGGSAVQFVGAGTTKLSLDLWFDASAPLADGSAAPNLDVRKLTERVAYFIKPKQAEQDKWIPPGVRFAWGSFLFDGVMDSLNESLEFFSEDGRPQRASVSISLTSQQIQFQFGQQGAPGLGNTGAPGTQPLQQSRAGDSVQSAAARAGQKDWRRIAEQNGIEDPLRLPPGTNLRML